MRKPMSYDAKALKDWDTDQELPTGEWVPSRPYGYDSISLFYRLKLAISVFLGKSDVVTWR